MFHNFFDVPYYILVPVFKNSFMTNGQGKHQERMDCHTERTGCHHANFTIQLHTVPNDSDRFTRPSGIEFNNYLFQLELGAHFILLKIEQWPPEHDGYKLLPLIGMANI